MLTTFFCHASSILTRHEYLIRKYYLEHQRYLFPPFEERKTAKNFRPFFAKLLKRAAMVFFLYVSFMLAGQSKADATETKEPRSNKSMSCIGCIVSCNDYSSSDYLM